MTHHPHVHMIVPGGGLAPDGMRWISSRPAFLLPVRVLGTLFRRLVLEGLVALHAGGKLAFHGTLAHLADPRAFAGHLTPVRRKRWVVYAKPPFAGPQAVLAYLSRYTHRVAISSRRITDFDGKHVTFRVKDYRQDGAARHRTLTLEASEFIRRFLLHVLPRGFHRIRHYGFLTGPNRNAAIERLRDLVGEPGDGTEPGAFYGTGILPDSRMCRTGEPQGVGAATLPMLWRTHAPPSDPADDGPGAGAALRRKVNRRPLAMIGHHRSHRPPDIAPYRRKPDHARFIASMPQDVQFDATNAGMISANATVQPQRPSCIKGQAAKFAPSRGRRPRSRQPRSAKSP
jgi:hypothetical protein